MHVVGKLDETAADDGPFAGHAAGLTRRPLFDRDRGTVHHSVVHCELEPDGRVERHLHAFEQALYVLSGSLTVDVAGAREELGADDFLWIELGVPHAVVVTTSGARWLEVSAPNPGARFEDTVFSEGAGATPEVPYRRGHFDVGDLPEPSGNILAGAGTNVGGASVLLLVNQDFGASQFVLMALQYVPGGGIKEHDHAFEEGFFIIEGRARGRPRRRAAHVRPRRLLLERRRQHARADQPLGRARQMARDAGAPAAVAPPVPLPRRLGEIASSA